MFGDLKIIFNTGSQNLSVIFSRMLGELPRTKLPIGEGGSYSVSGNFLVSGASFEGRHVFNINHFITSEDALVLMAIWEISDARRRSLGNWQITIEDETEFFFEEKTAATKTRSSVAGTTALELNGGIYYYAKFQAFMPKAPAFGIDNHGDRVAIFTLQETGVKI